MFYGRLDAITSSGYVEGWAYDQDAPLQPLVVSVLADGVELAQGIASRYRWDLADAGCGTGWCAFRLRLSGSISRVRGASFLLRDAIRQVDIHQTAKIPLSEDHEPGISSLEEVITTDPTLVRSIDQLRGCNTAFADYIATHSAEDFVRAAYVYILGRPADASGLANYSALLRDGGLPPYELLWALHESDEFRAMPRLLIAPSAPGFVFQTA